MVSFRSDQNKVSLVYFYHGLRLKKVYAHGAAKTGTSKIDIIIVEGVHTQSCANVHCFEKRL